MDYWLYEVNGGVMRDLPTPQTIRASEEGIQQIDRIRKRLGWTRTRTPNWWLSAHVSRETLKRFWKRDKIRTDNFMAICQVLGVEQWQDLVDRSDWDREPSPANLTEVSEVYVERSPIESRCHQLMQQPGALLRIKAPWKMGKTLLLNHLCERAKTQGYRIVRLKFQRIESTLLGDLNGFLHWFCYSIRSELCLSTSHIDYWDGYRGAIASCTAYLQEAVLEPLDSPLVLAMDDVDRLFPYPVVNQDVFAMLRSWHEETLKVWKHLRVVIAYSTEDFGRLDINRSPFNVGTLVELPEFTADQVEKLILRVKPQLKPTELRTLVQALMGMVGGHPYLVQLALDELEWKPIALEQILQEAPTDAGIYATRL